MFASSKQQKFSFNIKTQECQKLLQEQPFYMSDDFHNKTETVNVVLFKPWIFLTFHILFVCLFLARQSPLGHGLLIHEVSRSHTQRRTTVCRTPLDEWSARRRDFYLSTHNTHNRQISIPQLEFEPTISASIAAADLRLRPRGYWDRHISYINQQNAISKIQ